MSNFNFYFAGPAFKTFIRLQEFEFSLLLFVNLKQLPIYYTLHDNLMTGKKTWQGASIPIDFFCICVIGLRTDEECYFYLECYSVCFCIDF